MTPSLYLDTSIIGYVTSRRSRDALTAAHQHLTRDWWNLHRHRFELHVSELVLFEAGRGDVNAARERLRLVEELPVLQVSDEARTLADRIFRATALPDKAASDAVHLALAAVNKMDFLATWNFTHMANAVVLKVVDRICRDDGYEPPIVCTPEELMIP